MTWVLMKLKGMTLQAKPGALKFSERGMKQCCGIGRAQVGKGIEVFNHISLTNKGIPEARSLQVEDRHKLVRN